MTDYRSLTRQKQLKVGTYLGEFTTSGMGQILKASGSDFAFVDMEHSGFTFETVKALLRHLHDAGIATVLRPPSKTTDHVSRACDVGAQAICLPMLGTVEEAQDGIDAMNYPPMGTRGCAFAMAHDDYKPAPVHQTMQEANDKTTLVPLLETVPGVENCEAIAALEGVDCLWIGHFDLSTSLGVPGQFDHPDFTAAVEKIMAAARSHGKSVGRIVGSAEEARAVFDQGCDFICYLGDMWLLQQALQKGYQSIKEAIAADELAGSGAT